MDARTNAILQLAPPRAGTWCPVPVRLPQLRECNQTKSARISHFGNRPDQMWTICPLAAQPRAGALDELSRAKIRGVLIGNFCPEIGESTAGYLQWAFTEP